MIELVVSRTLCLLAGASLSAAFLLAGSLEDPMRTAGAQMASVLVFVAVSVMALVCDVWMLARKHREVPDASPLAEQPQGSGAEQERGQV